MKISLKPAKGSTFVFALLPEKIQGKYAANYQSFDIISKGTVKVPKGREVAEYSWDGEFFGASKKNAAGVQKANWKSPKTCVKKLREWMNSGTELTLIVSGTWINTDVTITSFTVSPHGAYGDVTYSISFSKVRELKISTIKETKSGSKKKTKSRTKKKSSNGSGGSAGIYTVKTGDTLIKIASKNNCKWTSLYTKNKTVIEKVAKQHGFKSSDHGHWIFPGTKLTIP